MQSSWSRDFASVHADSRGNDPECNVSFSVFFSPVAFLQHYFIINPTLIYHLKSIFNIAIILALRNDFLEYAQLLSLLRYRFLLTMDEVHCVHLRVINFRRSRIKGNAVQVIRKRSISCVHWTCHFSVHWSLPPDMAELPLSLISLTIKKSLIPLGQTYWSVLSITDKQNPASSLSL